MEQSRNGKPLGRIQTPLAITGQVQGNPPETTGLNFLNKGVSVIALKKSRKFLNRHFNPRRVALIPDPKLDEPQPTKDLFRLFNLRELLIGNFRSIGDSGGKAGRGRFVPCREAKTVRKRPDRFLIKARFNERTAYSKFTRRL
jgi:hypothetical protein